MPGANAVVTPVNDPLRFDAPLPYVRRYYPYGFPVDIASDAREVMELARESWAIYGARFDETPMRVHVFVSEGSGGLPPAPVLRGQRHLLNWVSDQENFSVCDRLQRFAYCHVTRATVADGIFFRWHFLDAVIYMLLELNYITSLHAACIALDGAGVLLHGESGVGKSTLAYACARRGWTYISDDSSSLLWGRERSVIGEPHHFRFREEAPGIFPELRGLTVGRQLDHKPTIEVLTADLAIRTAPECRVSYMVFVDRRPGSRATLAPIGKAEVLERLQREVPVFDPALDAQRRAAVESIAEAPAFALLYGSFEEAIPLLEQMVRAGGAA